MSNADQERGEVELKIIRATNLAAKDSTGTSDPYCRISCIETTRSRKKKSSVKERTLDPVWNESFYFADTSADARIVVDVFDQDEDSRDDLIGKVTLHVGDMKRGELQQRTHELIDGDIEIAVAFRPGKGGSARSDEIEDPDLKVLLPGGGDGPVVRGKKFSAHQKDTVELMAEIGEIAQRLRQSHDRLFEDEDFAGPRALYIDPKRVPPAFLGGGSKKVEFLRPPEINPGMKLFAAAEAGDVADIEPDDIEQGQIGDCYLLAALATIASQPHLVKSLLVEDHGNLGLYGVKLFDWTGWTTVIVDDRFPCNDRGRQLFCKSDTNTEFWAALFEKAWAKYHGCYEAIEGGDTADTIAYLTGGRMDQIQFTDRPDPNAFWSEMMRAFAINEGSERDACFMCASGAKGSRGGMEDPESVPKEDPGGLVSGHAYSVLELREALGHRLIKLRNPWGSFEWTGDWGDNSPLWTPEAKRAFNFKQSDDGEFWMSWSDFLANFSRMGVVITVPGASPMVHLTGSWRSGLTAGGEDEWLTFNPRYLLQVTKRTTVHLTLSQPDTRELGGGGFLEMHVRVFLLGAASDPRSPVEAEQLLDGARKTVWYRSGTLSVDIDPSKGHHVIVVSLWAPGWEGDYGLTAACEATDARLSLQELEPLKPEPAAAGAMRAKPLSNKCATCLKPCALGRGSKYFKKVRWHDGPCYCCASCKTPFATERSAESFGAPGAGAGASVQPRPIHDVHEDAGAMHGFCQPCFRAKFAPRCQHCQEPVDSGSYYTVTQPVQGRVHAHCYEAFREATADKCPVCQEPVTGTYYNTDDGKVHVHCYDQFQTMSADKCIVCAQPILGSFYNLDEGKVHSEGDCYDKHRAAQAPKCLSCLKPVLGQYYEVPEGAIHAEGDCFDKWQRR